MLLDRTVSDEGRMVWDATPVNQFCTKELSSGVAAETPGGQAMLWWKPRLPGIPVSDTFKLVVEDAKYFPADCGLP